MTELHAFLFSTWGWVLRICCKLSGQEEGGGDIETCLPLGAPEELSSLIFLVALVELVLLEAGALVTSDSSTRTRFLQGTTLEEAMC